MGTLKSIKLQVSVLFCRCPPLPTHEFWGIELVLATKIENKNDVSNRLFQIQPQKRREKKKKKQMMVHGSYLDVRSARVTEVYVAELNGSFP